MNIGSNEELLRSIRAHGYDAETPIIGVLCERLECILDELEDALTNLAAAKQGVDRAVNLLGDATGDAGPVESTLDLLYSAQEHFESMRSALTNR